MDPEVDTRWKSLKHYIDTDGVHQNDNVSPNNTSKGESERTKRERKERCKNCFPPRNLVKSNNFEMHDCLKFLTTSIFIDEACKPNKSIYKCECICMISTYTL